jgi:hypothetical protein
LRRDNRAGRIEPDHAAHVLAQIDAKDRAICPARGVGGALALPYVDTEAMHLRVDEISRLVAEGARAVLLLDRTGWDTTSNLDTPKTTRQSFCLYALRS